MEETGRGKDRVASCYEEELEGDTRKTEFCTVPNILANAEFNQLI